VLTNRSDGGCTVVGISNRPWLPARET